MNPLTDQLKENFQQLLPAVDFCSLRIVENHSESLSVRRGIVQPPHKNDDLGAMLTVYHRGGMGYAATSELTTEGLKKAFQQACSWAEVTRRYSLIDFTMLPQHKAASGEYTTPVEKPWSTFSLTDKIDLLQQQNQQLNIDPRIKNWFATLHYDATEITYLDSIGSHFQQRIYALAPMLLATAYRQGESQSRSFGHAAFLRQGGLEVLEKTGFYTAAATIAEQAIALLEAPNCPSQKLDVILAPDQMALQIHESIGHPLELDRILGDERNYAGTSFVTLDMFGEYQYGSELLNITFDPTVSGEIASYAYDDDGDKAERQYLIKEGLLLHPLGSILSQNRANSLNNTTPVSGVANSRACNWNRPPIDRMANINLEAGNDTLSSMISQIENGIYMETNRSWSIDDSRNKFQFGCEWAQLIKDGELTQVVKNPNYRGISAHFWRSLDAVGGAQERQIMGTAYCGKGEPNQAITVGHAAPPCRFRNVAVFGGE